MPLPLDSTINRCLAHGDKEGEWCERRYQCACHETIKHDHGNEAPAAYRKCSSSLFVAFLPIEGFPIEDDNPACDDASTGHIMARIINANPAEI
ncbi:hypothetical protein [Dechloromonas sp. CZR5]|uniref:hypothetical protein n=1 Tax=Dechloromonas sp. CZR5 TaxID=2608630 RepID=UPI00123CF7F3|nr:hypothetical protein [Dechloromonas sp. CZR5]